MTPGPSQTDKTVANEMAVLSVASLDGPMSMLPQLGDSEEKLRQVGTGVVQVLSVVSWCVLRSVTVSVLCSVRGCGSSS